MHKKLDTSSRSNTRDCYWRCYRNCRYYITLPV